MKADLGGRVTDVRGSSRLVYVNTCNFGWIALSVVQVSLWALCRSQMFEWLY